MSKISVVVPIYNPGKKLNKCIKSILNQTFTDFELILVNDGSTDSSLHICNKYKDKDSRIKVINKNNEGSILTRRRGIEESTSNYIMFVDADDWVDTRILELLYKEIINNDVDIVACNSYKVLGDNAIIKRKNNSIYFEKDTLYEGENVKEKLAEAYLHGHPFPAGLVAKLYKKSLLLECGNYLNRIKFLGDDLYYNLEMFLKAKNVKVITHALYYYRVGGFTGRYMEYHFNDIVNGYEIQKEVIEKYYLDTKQKRYDGISIMLLNSFKTSLSNIISSNLDKQDIYANINKYVNNSSIKEAIYNDGAKKYFEKVFLSAIENKDIEFLYFLGKSLNKNLKRRQRIIKLISKINIL